MKNKFGLILILIAFVSFTACDKDGNSNLPLSADNWVRAAPVPNVNSQSSSFRIVSNINKEIIAETPSPSSSTNQHYYYSDASDGWFSVSNFRSSSASGESIYSPENLEGNRAFTAEERALVAYDEEKEIDK